MHRCKVLAVAVCVLGLGRPAAAQQPEEWKALVSFRPKVAVQEAVQRRGKTWTVHRIEDGTGRLNLDYYPIKVVTLPTIGGRRIDASGLLSHIRKNLNNFVDKGISEIEPYKSADETRWKSDAPEGALVLINIKLTLSVTDLALVVTSMDSPNEWVFSTVRGGSGWKAINDRDNPGAHPVSGNRAFGFHQNGSGWTFYTRGADRATRPMDEFWGIPGARDIGFLQADKLWKSFQTKVANLVNTNGGKAEIDTKAVFSKRFDWESIRSNKRVYDTSGQPAWVPVPPVRN
jgi:hypothetical protein